MTGDFKALFSKFAAVAILAVLIGGFLSFVLLPVSETYADLNERLESERKILGRLTAAENTTKTGSQPAIAPQMTNIFLEGESDAIRIAGLQSKLSESAQLLQLRLKSTQAVLAREDSGTRLVGVQTQLAGPIEQVQRFVHAIETASPPLFVDALSISKGPASGDLEPTELDVRLVVLGATPAQRVKP
jgi:Type II secretion system (T2SS), protein M subtype b